MLNALVSVQLRTPFMTAPSKIHFYLTTYFKIKMTYTTDEITDILVEFASSGTSMRKYCEEKGTARTTLQAWLDGKVPTHKKLKKRNCKPQLPDVEEELAEWVRSERSKGKAIWRTDISEKAVQIAKSKGITTFQGSGGYITKFMQRNSFSLRAKTQAGRKMVFSEKDQVNTV